MVGVDSAVVLFALVYVRMVKFDSINMLVNYIVGFKCQC